MNEIFKVFIVRSDILDKTYLLYPNLYMQQFFGWKYLVAANLRKNVLLWCNLFSFSDVFMTVFSLVLGLWVQINC